MQCTAVAEAEPDEDKMANQHNVPLDVVLVLHWAHPGPCRGCSLRLASENPKCRDRNVQRKRWVQGPNTGDSSIVLRTLTNERSHPFRGSLQMRKFVSAALTHCKIYNDAAFVLHCLGSPETAGRKRLVEICQLPHAVNVSILLQCFAGFC